MIQKPHTLQCLNSHKNGYNGTAGGKVFRGEHNPMWGRKHTEETKAQMKASRMGDPRPKSEIWRRDHGEKMRGENNPKRITSILDHRERGIDITAENIRKVFLEENNNISQTAKKIGCSLNVIKSFVDKNILID